MSLLIRVSQVVPSMSEQALLYRIQPSTTKLTEWKAGRVVNMYSKKDMK